VVWDGRGCGTAVGIDLDRRASARAAKGTVGKLPDALATWRQKTQAALAEQAVPCGHLIPQEQPEMVISHFRRFFADAWAGAF
jgi:hypothetical protein